MDGKVFLGNCDGVFYAVHAHGTAPAGKRAWQCQSRGPILYSAACGNTPNDRGNSLEESPELWRRLPGARLDSPRIARSRGRLSRRARVCRGRPELPAPVGFLAGGTSLAIVTALMTPQ
ncbi:MAG: hypothetical protein JXQ71_18125 [Verrucomicrobia bacterium]|nr:hypothetical protein [Verrucomicrobiota bacterium]